MLLIRSEGLQRYSVWCRPTEETSPVTKHCWGPFLGSKPRVLLGESSLSRLLCAPTLSVSWLHVYFMNVGRDGRIALDDDSARSYYFKRVNVFFISCFCLLFLQVVTEAWFVKCTARREKQEAFSSSSSSSRLVVSHCIWTALVSFSVEATETVLWHFVEESRKSESVTVAYGGRAGLKRIASLSVLLLIALLSGQRWAFWGAACLCLHSSLCAIAAVSKTPCSGSRGETVQFLYDI